MVEQDKVGNVDPAGNEEVNVSLVKSESEVSLKIGERLVKTNYRVYNDDRIEFDIPEGMEEEEFAKYAPSAQALINKANFEKNERIKRLEEENRRLKGDGVKAEEPIKKSEGNDPEYKLTPQDYGFKTEEELITYIEDYPTEYARKTAELHNKLLTTLASNINNKLTKTQTESVLRNQALADKLDYDDFVKFTKENGLEESPRHYNIFKKVALAERERDVDLKAKQDGNITFRKTGADTSAKSTRKEIDWSDPLNS